MNIISVRVPDPSTQPYLKQDEAAALLGISVRSVGNRIKNGDIYAIRTGRLWRIPTARFLEMHGLAPTAPTGPTAA